MKILLTAGPTREALDPVRFLSNRSSGKMGYALAKVAVERGHEVVLISGPVALTPPEGLVLESVESAQDMHDVLLRHLPSCDCLIMSAAVADWRPRQFSDQKLKKRDMSGVLELERTPDILDAVRPLKQGRIHIGFAAETENLQAEARRKLEQKDLDLIVANDVSRADAGFAVDTNAVTLIPREGELRVLPVMRKTEVAEVILDWLEEAAEAPSEPSGA